MSSKTTPSIHRSASIAAPRTWAVWLLAVFLSACGGGGAAPADAPPAAPAAPVVSLTHALKTLVFDWAAVPGATHYRLEEQLAGGSFTPVGADLPEGTTHVEHTAAIWRRVGAVYRVSACNATGCGEAVVPAIEAQALNQSIGYVKASNTNAEDRFGLAVALSSDGTTLAVGAPGEDSAADGIGGDAANNSSPGAGAVYVYVRQGSAWIQQAYLKASNSETNDFFGQSVALSANGNTLLVGAPGEDSAAIGSNGNQASNAEPNSGAAYIFERQAGTWSQTTYLKASNTHAGSDFGRRVALAGDGNTLVVGAPGESGSATGVNDAPANFNATGSGAAFVYRRSANGWPIMAYLKGNAADVSDAFGRAVAISHDGQRIAVGAPGEDGSSTGIGGAHDNGAGASGAVFLFSRNGNVWSSEAYVKASNTGTSDLFGSNVALSGDGSTLVVAANREESSAIGSVNGNQADNSAPDAGAVYAFSLNGGVWSQRSYIKASNTRANSFFGSALALNFDGSELAVGASGESNSGQGLSGNPVTDNAATQASGAVYLLRRSGNGWLLYDYLKASNAGSSDAFGGALALSADGQTLAIGAMGESSNATGIGGNANDGSAPEAGAVYLF